MADSGNGFHSWLWSDIPLEDDYLVKNFLDALSRKFTDDRVEIDTKVGNLSRVAKISGSIARKGSDTPDRPHRFARIIRVPTEQIRVTPDLLRAVIADCPPPQVIPMGPAPARPPKGSGSGWRSVGKMSDAEHILARARACLYGMADSVEGHGGHDQLFGVAIALVDGFGLSRTDAYRIFSDWNRDMARPPESEAQVHHKLDDAIDKFPIPSLNLLNAPRPGGAIAPVPRISAEIPRSSA
jgi:hypothetical protein